jgi:hypothetical protein
MSARSDDPLPPELDEIGRLLREQRRRPTPLELDELRQRVRRQAGSRRSFTPWVQKGSLLTSRLLITVLIAFGIVLSGTGATLAMAPNVVDTGKTTSFAQYGSDDDDDGNSDDDDDNNSDDDDDGTPPGGDVAGASDPGPGGPAIGVLPEAPREGGKGPDPVRTRAAVDRSGGRPELQPVRQRAEQAEELPFTGLAAIPILVVGVALLGSGLMLRRRANG